MLAVDPHLHKGLAKGTLALGQLPFVVGENVVNSPGVDVQLFPQVLG